MLDSVKATASTLDALTRQYEGITNNIANSSVSGYKRRVVGFVHALEARMAEAGGRITDKTAIDFSQGAMKTTERPLDMAINGDGFFVVESPDGVAYTRNGAFRLNSKSQLVDFANRTVAGKGGPITLPPDVSPAQIAVSGDGTVTASGRIIGVLKIVDFEDRSLLQSVGGNSFTAPKDAATITPEKIEIVQGCQESSNVNVVEELVNLITVTRMYQASMKTVNSDDDRMKSLIQVAMP